MIINANKTQCEPVITAFQPGGDLDVTTLCDCVEEIDQKTLNHFPCYVHETDAYSVNKLKQDMCPCTFFNDYII